MVLRAKGRPAGGVLIVYARRREWILIVGLIHKLLSRQKGGSVGMLEGYPRFNFAEISPDELETDSY